MALNLVLQGTMSNAGKSLLAAALCRIFKQDGYRVAPSKSQNMALNSFITAAGGEMGRAQVVQAEAAGLAPDVRMNPILLKPTTDVGSQVIVNGQVVGDIITYFVFTLAGVEMWQRAFAAKNRKSAKEGLFLGTLAYGLTIPLVWFMGVVAHQLDRKSTRLNSSHTS